MDAFDTLLKKGLITISDVIQKAYELGYNEGYGASDTVKNQHMQLTAMRKK